MRKMKLPIIAASLLSALLAAGHLGAQDMPRWGEQRRFSSQVSGGGSPFMGGPLVGPAPGYYQPGYFGTPWYIPQTRKYKNYPQQYYDFPKLGLQYNYPYAYQFGIQVPPETDQPFYVTPGQPSPPVFPAFSSSEAEVLMKKGLYAEAGRRLAAQLPEADAAAPELYLLLAEALFAVGKMPEAEITLRQAIETAPDLDFLGRANLVGDFPSKEALDEKLKTLDGAPPLLRGTFLNLAGQGEKGLAALREIQDKDPAAKRVFLRFIGAAFGPEEEKKNEPQPAPQQQPPQPPQEQPR